MSENDNGNPFLPTKREATDTALVNVEQSREVAEIQAMVVMAKRDRRNPIEAMDRILAACTRQTLAETALYSYSKGGTDITGPSIRLAEELARGWGNILCGVTELSRENGKSECLAYAWDMETNFRDQKKFQVRHWRDTKKGGYQVTEERDIYELVANMGARRKRACLLAIIPGDVAEAAQRQCEDTLKAKADTSPAAVKKMVEAFGKLGVSEEQIKKRIQRRIESINSAQIVQLRKIYNSLKDGMSSPADWFEADEALKVASVKERLKGKSAPATEITEAEAAEIAAREAAEAGEGMP